MTGRQIALLAAVAFAIASPVVQAAGSIGLSASEFSRSGDQTLRAAGYAFSIWSLIYAGLVAFAIHQALPRQRDDRLLDAIWGPAFVAITGTGLWIWASAFDARWASVGIIVVSAGWLTLGLVRAARTEPRPSLAARALVWWPLCLLAGWLTIASAINILTVMTAEGLLADTPRAAAFAGIVAVLIVALLVLRTPRLSAHAIPIAWGLAAVWVAENGSKSDVAAVALASAVLVAAYAAWQSRPNAATR
ncbi:MAG: hypothetical protein AB1942_05330 [Pseudomonadota bacterium]